MALPLVEQEGRTRLGDIPQIREILAGSRRRQPGCCTIKAPIPAHAKPLGAIWRRAAAYGLLSTAAAVHEYLEDDAMTLTRGWIESLVLRVQTAFLENPMLSLTLPAAQRRFGVDEAICAGVLGALVDARVLSERQGVYRRYRPQPAVRPAA